MKHYKSPHPREDSSWLNKVYTFPSPFPVPVASKIMIGSKGNVSIVDFNIEALQS